MSNRHVRAFTVIALGMLVTSGTFEGTKGLALPHFLRDLGVSPATGAAIFSAGALGWSLTSFFFGHLSHHLGLKRPALGGFIVTIAALTGFFTLRIPALLYVSVAFIGMGLSLVEMSLSLPISLLYQGEKQAGMLNLLHGFFGLGTLFGSAAAGFMLAHGVGWRATMGLLGIGVTVWSTAFFTLPALPVPTLQSEEGGGYGPLFRDPLVWAAAIALFAAVLIEIGMTLFLPTFFQQVKGVAESGSAFFTTLFFLGFTGTRLAGTWLVQRFGSVRSMIALAGVGIFGLVGLLLLPGAFGWLSIFVGVGTAIGFATCVALVSNRYPDRVGRVYSLMYFGGGLAGIVTGPFMGWVAERAGMTVAFMMPLVGFMVLVGAIALYGWRNRSSVAL